MLVWIQSWLLVLSCPLFASRVLVFFEPGSHLWKGPPLHLSSRKKRCVKVGELRKKEKLYPRQLKITNCFFSNNWNTSGEGGRGREMEVLMLEDIEKDA